jgi:predicted phosphodiesterase
VTAVRYGVISDVHANLPALEVVLSEVSRIGVDAYACAGDLVGYGPQPNECVGVIRELGVPCVAGNHDLIVLGELSEDRCERLARNSLRWTREVLDPRTRDFLSQLPRQLELPGGVVVTHASLDDPQEYILRTEQAATQLARLAERYPATRILIVGHTHRAFAYGGISAQTRLRSGQAVSLDGAGRWLLNPGAVGQSREPRNRARFMILDLERLEATFHAVRYDVRRSRALLRRERLSTRSLHLPPWRLKAVLRPMIRTTEGIRTKLHRR